ncbi:hypothetical protein [Psychromarinibacter sp. S121]|uniref:hypothetical protein n=1 Tax=Psychromarinibacter sp. S121 TaxID=3415127 RepID=UPI003C7BD710
MIVTWRSLFVVFLSMLLIGTGAAAHSVGHDKHGLDFASSTDCTGHEEIVADHVGKDLSATHDHGHGDAELGNDQHCNGTPCPFLSLGPEVAFQATSTRRIAIVVFADEQLISNPADLVRRPPRT